MGVIFVECPLPGERALEIGALPGRLVQRQRGADHIGEIGGEAWIEQSAVAPGMAEPVCLGHAAHNKIEGPRGHGDPGRLRQHAPGVGQSRDHQAVPIGQDLIVEAGPHSFAAQHESIEDIVGLEIAPLGDVVMLHKKSSIFRSQSLDNFSLGPDVKLALLALRIGVERR